MATTLRRPSQVRRPSMIESSGNARSAMIMTSAQTTRDGNPASQAGTLENTYCVEPTTVVSSLRLKEVVQNVLETNLTGREYKSDEVGAMTRKIADQIKQGAKALGYHRYKFVALVSIGPPQPSTISMSSRCVWNDKYDTYAEYVYQNRDIYAIGLVYGMYSD